MAALVAAVLAVAVVVAATLLVVMPEQSPAGRPLAAERIEPARPGEVPLRVLGADGSPAQPSPLDLVVAGAFADLEDFWGRALPESFGAEFEPPAGGYLSVDSAAPSGSALCLTSPAQASGNAYYCAAGDGIVVDSAALVPVLLDRYGPAALAAALAHEFGHAVQARIGPTPQDRSADPERYPPILVEAQADCYAGAFLARASSGGSARVRLPPESLLRAVSPLLDFRDPADLPARDRLAHGLGLDRLTFVLTGLRQGAGACAAMTMDGLPLTLGRVSAPEPGGPAAWTPRFADGATLTAAATTSVSAFAMASGLSGSAVATELTPADPVDLTAAAPFGQFAVAAATALAAGRMVYQSEDGAACFVGAWAASVLGRVPPGALGSWPGDADEALDLVRSRPGATWSEVVAFADGFGQGLAGCGS